MAKFYTPGAIEHFVRFRDGSVSYLGTAVLAPEIEVRPAFLNVVNDLGGRTLPMDKVGDRTQHVVTTTLNRFDYETYKYIENSTVGPNGARKIDDAFTHGTLTFQQADVELILVNALAGTGATPSDYPRGRRYYSATLVGGRESTVGTRVTELTLLFECNEIFNAPTRTFTLFTEVAAEVLNGLPNVD